MFEKLLVCFFEFLDGGLEGLDVRLLALAGVVCRLAVAQHPVLLLLRFCGVLRRRDCGTGVGEVGCVQVEREHPRDLIER